MGSEKDIRDFGDVVDAIQAMEISHGQQMSALAQTVSNLAITTKEATNAASMDVLALTKELIAHPLTCPVKNELHAQIRENTVQLNENKKEIGRLAVFAGKIVGSVVGWGAAAGLAGFFLLRWLEAVFSNTPIGDSAP